MQHSTPRPAPVRHAPWPVFLLLGECGVCCAGVRKAGLRKCRATAARQRCWRLARRTCAARFAAERRRGRGCRSAAHGAAMSRPAPRPRPALCSAARAAPVRLARHLASGGAACASLRSAHGNAMSRTSPQRRYVPYSAGDAMSRRQRRYVPYFATRALHRGEQATGQAPYHT